VNPPSSRFGWRIYTSRGPCRVIRRQDLQPDDKYLDNPALVRSEIAAWARDSAHARTLLGLYEAAYGLPAWNIITTREVWIEERVEEAFRQGRLLLVPDKWQDNRTGGGGSGGQSQQAQGDATVESSQAPPPASSKASKEKTWIRFVLKDEDGIVMKNEDYVLVDTDGSRREGKLDENGEVYIPPILPPGDCTINFPKIHLNPRKRKS
jgi:hypothetical protein